jgi:hypothetical protein
MSKDKNTYYVLIEGRAAEIRNSMPSIRDVPADTYVICEYADGSINLFRSQFHMGRAAQSPWAMEEPADKTLPPHIKAYLLLLGI